MNQLPPPETKDTLAESQVEVTGQDTQYPPPGSALDDSLRAR